MLTQIRADLEKPCPGEGYTTMAGPSWWPRCMGSITWPSSDTQLGRRSIASCNIIAELHRAGKKAGARPPGATCVCAEAAGAWRLPRTTRDRSDRRMASEHLPPARAHHSAACLQGCARCAHVRCPHQPSRGTAAALPESCAPSASAVSGGHIHPSALTERRCGGAGVLGSPQALLRPELPAEASWRHEPAHGRVYHSRPHSRL